MDLDRTGSLDDFAAVVASAGPVVAVGGRTQWSVGGQPHPAAREVVAPTGIVDYEPAEMTVRCGAGTTVADLDAALGAHAQMCPLDPADPARATVGGVLAVGHSGIRRLRYGPLRDLLLQARYVSAAGVVVKAGGATVKNVSGFDLCRVLVGSLGTLGLLGEVVLRVRPKPAVAQWFAGSCDPFALRQRLHQPSSILWDGTTTWLLLEGHPDDVSQQAELAAVDPVAGPPALPAGGRLSLRPSALRDLTGTFLAEIGVGTVHVHETSPARVAEAAALHQRLKAAFDPTGRLNPGRTVAV